MTPEEKRALDALQTVRMPIASSGKRFRRDLAWRLEQDPEYKLTKRQALYLWFFVDRFRRQIDDAELRQLGAHRKITGELPPIYLEGDHRELDPKPARRPKLASGGFIAVPAKPYLVGEHVEPFPLPLSLFPDLSKPKE